MSLKFLKETSTGKIRKISADLAHVDPKFDLKLYEGKTVMALAKDIRQIRESIRKRKEGRYGSWLTDEGYVRDTLVLEGLLAINEMKQSVMETERLTPAMTYYRNTGRYQNMLSGERCTFLGESKVGWVPFKQDVRDAKAFLMLRHGDQQDFKSIYMEMADGRVDCFRNVSLEHITESSNRAKNLIEAYCDSRWDGAWPWEASAPETLKYMIESREDTRMKPVIEMQRKVAKLLREFEEGGMEQFELIGAAQDMISTVDSTISSLGKLASGGIEIMAKTTAGQDASALQAALGEPLNSAVKALTDLKAAISAAVEGGGMEAGLDNMDDLGTPADAMGDNPADLDDVDAMADVEIGGDAEERPMKGV